MRKRIWIAAALALLAVGGTATAVTLRAGQIVLVAHGSFSPKALPKYRDAPISLYGGGKLKTISGALPPILDKLVLEFDRHGSVQTKGLGACTQGQLEATTVPVARSRCPGSIVGKGFGTAIVELDEGKRLKASSPLTIFNGPKVGGEPSILAHAHITVPIIATFVVPVVIEKINKGVYGYRTEAKIPTIAGGAGHPVSGYLRIGRRWTYKGKKYSFVNARCETGHLQARGKFSFKDGTSLIGTFLEGCRVRG